MKDRRTMKVLNLTDRAAILEKERDRYKAALQKAVDHIANDAEGWDDTADEYPDNIALLEELRAALEGKDIRP
jgi:hypothetical protein